MATLPTPVKADSVALTPEAIAYMEKRGEDELAPGTPRRLLYNTEVRKCVLGVHLRGEDRIAVVGLGFLASWVIRVGTVAIATHKPDAKGSIESEGDLESIWDAMDVLGKTVLLNHLTPGIIILVAVGDAAKWVHERVKDANDECIRQGLPTNDTIYIETL